MFGFYRPSIFAAAVVAVTSFLTIVPTQSYAATGTVRIRVTNVGFIFGVGGGSAGTIGIAGTDFVGTAAHLRTAADIAGTYSAVGAGIAVAGGAKAATLQNGRGVVLTLRGRQVGFQASLGLSGLTITMQ